MAFSFEHSGNLSESRIANYPISGHMSINLHGMKSLFRSSVKVLWFGHAVTTQKADANQAIE